MKRPQLSLGVALLAIAATALPLSTRAADSFKELTPDQVEKMLGAPDVRVIDVNPRDLFEKSHVPGAVSAAAQKLESLLPADKSTRLVFYCANTL